MKDKIYEFKGKRVTVMGLGLNGGGVEAAKWLSEQGAKVTVTDLKSEEDLKPSLEKLKGLKIDYVFKKHRKKDFQNVDLVVKNPGVSPSNLYLLIAQNKGIPIETDISLFFQFCPAPIIGITGTKGKSTTTALTGEFLKTKSLKTVVAGNIGISPLKFLNKISSQTPVVLELSSWQLESLEKHHLSPHIGLLTNIFPDHLNYYHNLEDYIQAKKLIFQYQKEGDYAILNYDKPITRKLSRGIKSNICWFSQKANSDKLPTGLFMEKGQLFFYRQGSGKKICSAKDIKMEGESNLENVLAATAAAIIADVKPRAIKKILKNFRGVPHRLELVKKIKGINYYNDTAATIPEAAISAIKFLSKKGRIILIAGGQDKRLDFKDLVRAIVDHCGAVILFAGSGTEKIKKYLKLKGYPILGEVSRMPEAIHLAREVAERGDIVLLSPACASFGLFKNEFDRGNQFKKEVSKLSE